MAAAPETIDQGMLEKLVESRSVRGANVVAQTGGWGVVIQYGTKEGTLAVRRGSVRLWAKLETLVTFLSRMGIDHFEVDASGFDVGTKQIRTRRDASERLREAHEAAAYDKWFREQVQESLADPRPNVSHAEVKADIATRRAKLLQRSKGANS
ncbi:antitoxin PaaA2 family protein [Paraburkholderia sediminicola]